MPKHHKRSHAADRSLLDGIDLRKPVIVVLVALVLLDLVVKHYRYFAIDGTFGFAAWFGALACLTLVGLAYVVASLVRTPEDTYDE
jgi:hypothetical protein